MTSICSVFVQIIDRQACKVSKILYHFFPLFRVILYRSLSPFPYSCRNFRQFRRDLLFGVNILEKICSHLTALSGTCIITDITRSRCCSYPSVIGVLLRERPRIQIDLAIVQVSKLNPAIVRVIKVNPCPCAGKLSQLCWNIEPVLLEKLSQLCWNIEPVLLEKLSQLCWKS